MNLPIVSNLLRISGIALLVTFCGCEPKEFRTGEKYAIQGNHSEATKQYQIAADNGSAQAQAHLGWAYTDGQGVPQDLVEGEKWLRRAYEQGHDGAAYGLGRVFALRKEKDRAIEWWRRAAEMGHAAAMVSLGDALRARGRTDAQTEALQWYRKAAVRSNHVGESRLKELNQPIPKATISETVDVIAYDIRRSIPAKFRVPLMASVIGIPLVLALVFGLVKAKHKAALAPNAGSSNDSSKPAMHQYALLKSIEAGVIAGIVAGLASHYLGGGKLTLPIWIAAELVVISTVKHKVVATMVFVLVGGVIMALAELLLAAR